MKKLLIFSHASVLEINRHLYYQLGTFFQAEIKIVSPSSWRGDLIKDLFNQKNTEFSRVEIISLPISFSGNGSLFFYRKNLKHYFQDWIPDMIFVDEEPWSLACLQIYRAFPKSELFFYTKQNLRKKLPFPFGLIQKYVFNKSTFCFSVSDEVSEVLRWKGFKGEIKYLPHSFEPEKFYPRQMQAISEVRSSLGIASDALVIGYFGRIEPEKGIIDLLAAMKIIEADGFLAKPHYLIVGNGTLESEISIFSTQNSSVKIAFKHAIPHGDVGKTLAAVDILILPSKTVKNWKEQFGRILVEAMACGAAVIGSDSGEIPHLIKKSGGGLIFHEGSEKDLAEKILTLLKDKGLLSKARQSGTAFAHSTLTHQKIACDLGEKLGLSAIDHE